MTVPQAEDLWLILSAHYPLALTHIANRQD
jgi:hypothetical protein